MPVNLTLRVPTGRPLTNVEVDNNFTAISAELEKKANISIGGIASSGLTMNTNKLLGRTTAAFGTVEEITVGTGLVFDTGTLSVVPIDVVTLTTDGLMSAADKVKLDGVTEYVLPIATDLILGGVKQGDNITIAPDGTISATATPYTLPVATTTVLGGVKEGSNISIAHDGTISAAGGSIGITDDVTTDSTVYVTFTPNTTGTMTGVSVSSTNLKFNPLEGMLSAISYNSLSDMNRKSDIKDIAGALNTVDALRGVEFSWNDTGKPSSGVIAQEIESVLPHLVSTDNTGEKTVNYSGIIAYLIESIKELNREVNALKQSRGEA